jgi:dihydroorotate dehydrogenase
MSGLTDMGAALLRKLDPETAHGLAIRALQTLPLPTPPADDPILATTMAGLTCPIRSVWPRVWTRTARP